MNDITNVLRHVFIDSQSLCNAVNGATLRLQVCDHVTLPAAVAGSRRSKQTTCLIYVFNTMCCRWLKAAACKTCFVFKMSVTCVVISKSEAKSRFVAI